jgi:hypothetical protein
MKLAPFMLSMAIAPTVFGQTSYTLPAQTLTLPAQTINIAGQPVTFGARSVSLGAQTVSVGVGGGSTVTPPPVALQSDPTPPASGAFWLYKAGKFAGAGDYSYGNGQITYGPSSVIITGDEAWQPRMPNDDFNTGPYTYVTVSLKPTQKQTWISGMEMIGDVTIPGSTGPVDLSRYGPSPAAIGQWNVYKIPLTAFGIKAGSGLHVYKIMFQGQNVPGPSSNKVEVDAVGFLP